MAPYPFNNPNYVISSTNGTTILVHNTAGDLYSVKSTPSNWKHVTTIGKGLSYDELDISGTVFSDQKLKGLAKDLLDSRLFVNREGYCLLNTDGITNKAFYVECYRLNDFFGFSKYKIDPLVTTVWSRCDMYDEKQITNALENKMLQDVRAQLSKVRLDLADCQKNLAAKDQELDQKATELTDLQNKLSDTRAQLDQKTKELDDLKSKEKDKGKGKADDVNLTQCQKDLASKSDELNQLRDKLKQEEDRSRRHLHIVDSLTKTLEGTKPNYQKGHN